MSRERPSSRWFQEGRNPVGDRTGVLSGRVEKRRYRKGGNQCPVYKDGGGSGSRSRTGDEQ